MADLLQTGSQWLAGQLKSHAGRSVIYSRGSSTVTITATKGQADLERLGVDPATVEDETADWILTAADLILAGAVAEPALGDRITETIGSTTAIYQVVSIGGARAWRYTDGNRYQLRVTTQLISES